MALAFKSFYVISAIPPAQLVLESPRNVSAVTLVIISIIINVIYVSVFITTALSVTPMYASHANHLMPQAWVGNANLHVNIGIAPSALLVILTFVSAVFNTLPLIPSNRPLVSYAAQSPTALIVSMDQSVHNALQEIFITLQMLLTTALHVQILPIA